MFKVSVTGMLP